MPTTTIFRAILSDLPSSLVLRRANRIALGLAALECALSCHASYVSGVAADHSGLYLLGWVIGVLALGAFSVWMAIVLLVLLLYGPVRTICRGMTIVYHGFIPACVAGLLVVREAYAVAVRAYSRALQATTKAARDLHAGIASMTARDWLSLGKGFLMSLLLGVLMHQLWPWSFHVIGKLPSWTDVDMFQRFVLAFVFDAFISVFCFIMVVAIVGTIAALFSRRHSRQPPTSP